MRALLHFLPPFDKMKLHDTYDVFIPKDEVVNDSTISFLINSGIAMRVYDEVQHLHGITKHDIYYRYLCKAIPVKVDNDEANPYVIGTPWIPTGNRKYISRDFYEVDQIYLDTESGNLVEVIPTSIRKIP